MKMTFLMPEEAAERLKAKFDAGDIETREWAAKFGIFDICVFVPPCEPDHRGCDEGGWEREYLRSQIPERHEMGM